MRTELSQWITKMHGCLFMSARAEFKGAPKTAASDCSGNFSGQKQAQKPEQCRCAVTFTTMHRPLKEVPSPSSYRAFFLMAKALGFLEQLACCRRTCRAPNYSFHNCSNESQLIGMTKIGIRDNLPMTQEEVSASLHLPSDEGKAYGNLWRNCDVRCGKFLSNTVLNNETVRTLKPC